MIIVIDAGNSRIKWGIHDGVSWLERGNLPTEAVVGIARVAVSWPADSRIVACNVAGPDVEMNIQQAFSGLRFQPRWVRSEAYAFGIHNGYERPENLGADRWAALVGARTKTQKACLVVCAGTATTVDWLDSAGNFRGGIILPGVHLMLSALAGGTAQLPLARGEYRAAPRNTMDAIVSGCLHAQAGAIERMFAGVAREDGAVCLLTGGAAERIAPCLGIPCQMEETLVLDGLLRYAQAED